MYESDRPFLQWQPRTVALVGVSGRTTCAIGLAEALHQVGVPVQVIDAAHDHAARDWARLSGWEVPVTTAALPELTDAVMDAGKDGFTTVIVDTPTLTREPAGLVPVLSIATDVLLTLAPSPMDAAKVRPLTGTLFCRRKRLEKARGFTTRVLLNQLRGNTEDMKELLDPNRELTMPFGPTIPLRESYAQAFGEHPEQMVDAPFHALAARLLGSWAGVVRHRDPAPSNARIQLQRRVFAGEPEPSPANA